MGVRSGLQLLAWVTLVSSAIAHADDKSWLRVPKTTLDGTGIPVNEAAGEDALPNTYFHDLEPASHLKFGLIHSDLIQTAVVETPGEVTRSVDFPGDEVVRMQSGRTVLIDDSSGEVLIANAGDYFVVPAHWRGLWIFHSVAGKAAREHAMVSAPDYAPTKPALDVTAIPKNAPAARVLTPLDIEALKAKLKPIDFASPAGKAADGALTGNTILVGEPSFYLLASATGGTFKRPLAKCESVVRVVSGSVTLDGVTFGPDDVFVLKKSFQGTVRVSDGFAGLSVTSSGVGTPRWPAITVPTTKTCPVM